MTAITWHQRTREWELLEDLTFGVNGDSITVPAGFRCDLASIPRLLRWAINTYEVTIEAPVLHDWLYRNKGLGRYSRAEADRLFLRVMEFHDVGRITRSLAYTAVRLFGWIPWAPSRSELAVAAGHAARTGAETAVAVGLFDSWWAIVAGAAVTHLAAAAVSPYGRARRLEVT